MTRALTYARMLRGYSQLEVDERAGFNVGYTGKIEQPFPRAWPSGRSPLGPMLDLWLGALNVLVVVVDAAKAEHVDWSSVATAPQPRAPDMTLRRAQQIRDLRSDDPSKWSVDVLARQFGVRVGVILDIIEGKAYAPQAKAA